MSNYTGIARHPSTGKVEEVEWLDDYYGRHHYGVRFADGLVMSEEVVKEIKPPFTAETFRWKAIVREEVCYEVEVVAATQAEAEAAAIEEIVQADDLNLFFSSVEERDVVSIEQLCDTVSQKPEGK